MPKNQPSGFPPLALLKPTSAASCLWLASDVLNVILWVLTQLEPVLSLWPGVKKHLHSWAGKNPPDLFNHCPSPLPSPNGRPQAPSWQHALGKFQTKPQDSSAKRAQASRGFTSSPKTTTVLHNEKIIQPKFILFEQSQGEASLVARDLCLSAPVLGTEEAVEFPSEALYQAVLGS